MALYSNFIGIDIGKFTFVSNLYNSNETKEYENSLDGIGKFISEYKNSLLNSLCVLETTGGYEMELLLSLCHNNIAVHRANTRKVKSFIRSYGNDSKTDELDAKALALYGYERHVKLDIYIANSKNAMALYELVQRRQDLKQMLVAEKNRLQSPLVKVIKNSCTNMITALVSEIESITKEINTLIAQDENLQKKKEVLKSIPGIGDIISNELLVLLPELGTINRRQIASLAGLAPKANDSGKYRGYRATGHGRQGIKPSLFLAAMAARNSNSEFKTFYERLVAKGKKKKVALTALMRKIIVIANAKLKEHISTQIVAVV